MLNRSFREPSVHASPHASTSLPFKQQLHFPNLENTEPTVFLVDVDIDKSPLVFFCFDDTVTMIGQKLQAASRA